MVQTLYGLIAMCLVGIIMLHVNRGIHANEEKMMLNEVAAGVVEIGNELLDEIGKYDFDPNALQVIDDVDAANPNILLAENQFGGGMCNIGDATTQYKPTNCLSMTDFHNRSGTRLRRIGNQVVEHTIESVIVRYVSETSPHTSTGGTKTFAKEVIVTISSPLLEIGATGNPLLIQMSRVYTYPNI